MAESKAQLTDRLRREGRWEEFVARREALKIEGTPASDAWRVAALEFPPPAAVLSHEQTDLSPEDAAALADKPKRTMLEAVHWVFDHLDTPVTPAKAPSVGAWSLRARSSPAARAEFFKSFCPKLLPTRGQMEEPPTPPEDDGRRIDILARMGEAESILEKRKRAER